MVALAQSPSSVGAIAAAAQNSNDQSRQALVAVFGQVVNSPLSSGSAGGGDTLLASIFQVTNGALLSIGGALCGYGLFRRVARAASSGTAFEQGSLWGPLRTVWGVTSLVPTANGWSLAQLVMLWAASVMGVGTANLAVNGAAQQLQNGTPLVMSPVMPSTVNMARQIYEADLCMEGINYGLAEIANTGGSVDSTEYVNQQPTSDSGGFTLVDGQATYSCGGASINAAELLPASSSDIADPLADAQALDVSPIYRAQQSALSAMQTALDASAKSFVNAVLQERTGGGAVPNAEVAIQSAAAAYENSIQAASVSQIAGMSGLASQLVSNLQAQGWWMLGSWYQVFAMANTKISSAVAAVANVQAPSITDSSGPTEVWQSALEAYHVQEASSQQQNASPIGTPPTDMQGAQGSKTTNAIIAALFSPGQAIIKNIVSGGQMTGTSNQVNPLMRFKRIGDSLMDLADVAIGVTVGVSVAVEMKNGFSVVGAATRVANAFTGVGDMMGGFWKAVYPFVFILIIAFLFFGVTLSVLLPLVPFTIWFTGIINWLVHVAIGIVAAPIWAMAFLASDGEGFGQRTMHGWLFLLDMCLRPFLMVIGFFLGGGVMVVGGTFLGPAFSLAMQNVQFDSITGVVSVLGFLWVFTQVSLALVHSSFNLILILPDQAAAWFGGQAAARLGMDAAQIHSGFEQGKDKASNLPERVGEKALRASARPDMTLGGNGMER
jgi:conjugal transfer/type IV secretion protein DotA/TraY